MSAFSLSSADDSLGRPLARAAAAAVVVGAAALVLGLLLGRAAAAVSALAASWLYFAGLAAGSVAVSAAIRVAHGRWAEPVLPIADAAAAFFRPALLLLVFLVAGAHAFVPSLRGAPLRHAAVAFGLVVASAALFALGNRLVAAARRGERPEIVRRIAVVYLLAYAIVLSAWAFQLVMSIWRGPPATVLPPYYFLGAFVSGLAWIALVVASRGVSGPDLRHDVGKLLFALIVVWSYLLWSLFLPTWYANVPAETGPLLARWRGPWRPVIAIVLVSVFAWPFWLLFSERMKRRRGTLAAGAAAILGGLLLERFLLVLPSVHLARGAGSIAVGAGVAAGVAGVFLLAVGPRLGPRDRPQPTAPPSAP